MCVISYWFLINCMLYLCVCICSNGRILVLFFFSICFGILVLRIRKISNISLLYFGFFINDKILNEGYVFLF